MKSALDASSRGARGLLKTQASVREAPPGLVRQQAEMHRREKEPLRKGHNGASAGAMYNNQQPPASPANAGTKQASGHSQTSTNGIGNARRRAAATGSADTQQAPNMRQPGASSAGSSRKHAAAPTGAAVVQQARQAGKASHNGTGSSSNSHLQVCRSAIGELSDFCWLLTE